MAELRRYNSKTQKWEPLLGDGGANTDIVAPAYDSVSTSYSINDLVIENNKLYSAKEPIAAPAGQFNSSKWNETDIASAKADLVDGKVPVSQLPSYVDDVVEYATYNDLPQEGEQGKIYVVLSDNKVWRWSGSTYIEIAANEIFRELVITGSGISRTSNYTASELIQFIDEGKTLIYDSCLLKEISRATTPQRSITFQYLNPQNTTIYNIGIFEDKSATFSTNLNIPTELNAKASKSSVDAIKNGATINSFGGVESALSDKIDEPESEGYDGYVLTTDGNGGRSWSAPSGGGSDVEVYDEDILAIDRVPNSNELRNLINNSTLSIGDTIYIKENGENVGYQIVEDRTTSVILLRKDIINETYTFDGDYQYSLADYKDSEIHEWMTSDKGFLKRFSYNAFCQFKFGEVYCHNDNGNHMKAKAFIPSATELTGIAGHDYETGESTSSNAWSGATGFIPASGDIMTRTISDDPARIIELIKSSSGTSVDRNKAFKNKELSILPAIFLRNTARITTEPYGSSGTIYVLDENIEITDTVNWIQDGEDFYDFADRKLRNEVKDVTEDLAEIQEVLTKKVTEPLLDGQEGQVLATDGLGGRVWVDGGNAKVKNDTDLVISEGVLGPTISGLSLGDVVKVDESNTSTPSYIYYLVVEKRTDDNAVILLRIDCTDLGQRASSGNYATGAWNTWLNSDSGFLSRFNQKILNSIVSIPVTYRNGATSTNETTMCKAYLPTQYQLMDTNPSTYPDVEGQGTYMPLLRQVISNDDNTIRKAFLGNQTGEGYVRTPGNASNAKYWYNSGSSYGWTYGNSNAYALGVCLAISDSTPIEADGAYYVLLGKEGSDYTGTIDKVQDGNDLYKLADQDVRAMLAAPSVQGTYTLKCEVNAQGEPTISWVLDT